MGMMIPITPWTDAARIAGLTLLLLAGLAQSAAADETAPAVTPAPPRNEGEGPYTRLILRGVTVINGTGAPAFGPADIVIEGNRIVQVKTVSAGGAAQEGAGGLAPKQGVREIDLRGHYVMPGLVDMHGHIGGDAQGVPAEYVYKLWMGHGITTVRDPGCGNGLDWCVSEARRSQGNEIVAPRIFPFVFFVPETPLTTPEQGRQWVRHMKAKGALGVKCFGYRPDVLQAVLEETKKQGMRSACHLSQLQVARGNALSAARWGVTTIEHWYGLPEALLDDRTVQNFPPTYNFNDELGRFREAGRLWRQAAPPGSEKYEAVIEELLKLDVTLDPTFTIYLASRDLMRARRADWHEQYTLPSLWDFYTPNPEHHGSYFFDWGTEDELAWRDNYRPWMAFVNDYKNRGGRVTVGSDSGFIYQLYGFGTIQELELLREAGFHPLEVIRSATLSGAQALGAQDSFGSIEPGKLADLVVLEENPLANFKTLYGVGHLRLDQEGRMQRVGGVKYTLKDGIVYDAKQLLAQVRDMVAADKRKRGLVELVRH